VTTPQETSAATAAAKAEEVTITDNPTKKDIQNALKNAGFYTGVVDGKFGLMTKKAVEKFQEANGLKADGKVGPNTWNKLKSYLSATKE
jgi:peptidoglycan hydrolase-like protein with peptidoglycan-binding domain